MGFQIRYDVDPGLLGQGAYAGGLAQYEQQQQQFSLQQAQLQNQANQAAANRSQQLAMQARSQQAAQQQQLLNAQNQSRFADQQQVNYMARLDQQTQSDQQMMEMQGEQKIMLSEQAFKLKENEMQGRIKAVNEMGWDPETTANAISKLRFGFDKYDVEKPPTPQELFEAETFEAQDGTGTWTRTERGGWKKTEKPVQNVGEPVEIDMGDGITTPGYYDKDGHPVMNNKDAYKQQWEKKQSEIKLQQEQEKQAIEVRAEAYKSAKEMVDPNMFMTKDAEGNDKGIDYPAYYKEVERAMALEMRLVAGEGQPQGEEFPSPQAPAPQAAPEGPEVPLSTEERDPTWTDRIVQTGNFIGSITPGGIAPAMRFGADMLGFGGEEPAAPQGPSPAPEQEAPQPEQQQAQQQQAPQPTGPPSKYGITPENLRSDMFRTSSPDFRGPSLHMEPEQVKQTLSDIAYDLSLLKEAYSQYKTGKLRAMYANEEHRNMYKNLQAQAEYLRENYASPSSMEQLEENARQVNDPEMMVDSEEAVKRFGAKPGPYVPLPEFSNAQTREFERMNPGIR